MTEAYILKDYVIFVTPKETKNPNSTEKPTEITIWKLNGYQGNISPYYYHFYR